MTPARSRQGGDMAALALLGVLCALPPLSIDMGLPALPALGRSLHADTGMAGLTVSLFMAGFALTPIAYGVLSDRYGRRPLLLAGLGLFALGGLAASFAPSIGWLLCMRFVQGAGAGVGPTLAFAATRDRFAGTTLGRRLASLTMLLNTAPLIAPTVGAAVLALGGWRGIYAVLAVAGVALLAAALLGFAETLPSSARQTRPISAELGNALRTLRRRPEAVGAAAAYGLSAGSMFAYVSGSPMLLIGQLGASPSLYAGLFALTASGIVCGAWLSGRLLHNHELRPLAIGAPISVLAPICALGLFLGGEASIVTLMPCLVAATFAYGLIAPAASQVALNPLPEIAGIAAAVINTGQMACMSLSSLLVAIGFHQFHGAGMAAVMLLFALAATLGVAAIALHRRGLRAATVS